MKIVVGSLELFSFLRVELTNKKEKRVPTMKKENNSVENKFLKV
jgi:hypothetical protein